jgi:Domain of unknown function (DUF4407)
MNNLSWLMIAICWFVRYDPDLLARSPIRDRMACVSEALLLGLVGLITAITWTVFWTPYVPYPMAYVIGGIAFAVIVLLDSAIGAADPQPEGILRPPGLRRRWDWWAKIAIRVGVSVVLSIVTSEGATIAWAHESILERLTLDMQAHNREAQAHFEQKVSTYRQQHFGTLLDELKKQQDLIDQTTKPLDDALQLEATADNRLAEANERADREHNGKKGSVKGDGPLFKAALKDQAAAQAELVKAKAQVAIYQPRVDQAKQQLKVVQGKLDEAEAASRDDIAKLEAEKNAELTTLHSDPLSARRALREIYADPETGEDARNFSFEMKLVLITLELSYLLVRLLFAHTSVYTILLLADTRLRADAVHGEYRRRRAALGADEPPVPPRALPPIRIMSWDPPAVPPPDGSTPPHRDNNPDDDREAAD